MNHEPRSATALFATFMLLSNVFAAPDPRPAAAAYSPHRTFDDRLGEVVWAVAFSPDGKFVASAGGGTFTQHAQGDDFINVGWGAGRDFDLRIWEVATGKLIRTVKGPAAMTGAVAWSPDGRAILSGSADGSLRLWDAETGKELRAFAGHQALIATAGFSRDGKTVYSGARDGSIRLWNVTTGQEQLRLAWIAQRVWDVALSPDGTQIAACGDSRTVQIFDARTGRSLQKLEGHQDIAVRVVFSPDGKQFATGGWDNSARVWDLSTGKLLQTFEHNGRVEGLAFTSDGKRLLTGSLDRLVRLWDVTMGVEAAQFKGHLAPVSRIDLSRDGRFLASGSWDGTVRLWRMPDSYDPVIAWQVFPEAYGPPQKLAAAVEREVAALGDESAPRREQAFVTLRELGDEIVPLLQRIDPETLLPEQRQRIRNLLKDRVVLSNEEAAARRRDRQFLLDCIAAGDVSVARQAIKQFEQATGSVLTIDPDAPQEVRAAAVARLRAKD